MGALKPSSLKLPLFDESSRLEDKERGVCARRREKERQRERARRGGGGVGFASYLQDVRATGHRDSSTILALSRGPLALRAPRFCSAVLFSLSPALIFLLIARGAARSRSSARPRRSLFRVFSSFPFPLSRSPRTRCGHRASPSVPRPCVSTACARVCFFPSPLVSRFARHLFPVS